MNELKIPTNLETISLNEQTNYRLMEIGKIKDYFNQEIKYQQLLTSKLSKYLTGFDYAYTINCFLWYKHFCPRRKTFTWIDPFCFFLIVLFNFWCC